MLRAGRATEWCRLGTVRRPGSFSDDTQIGGSTTVPMFQVLRVEDLTKG